MIDKTNPCVWDALKNSDRPIVLYGMGNGADKVLEQFAKRNIKCSGVMASDDFVRHQSFHGFTVKKMSELEAELSDFTVALCFASSLDNVMSHIKYVADKHPMLVPNVPVYGDEIIDDEFLRLHNYDIQFAFSLMSDQKSQEVLIGALNFLYSGRLKYLDSITTDKAEAFENILRLNDNERYLDLGAYRGDTVDEFLHFTNGRYDTVTAVEPNLKNHKKLVEHCKDMRNIRCVNAGISDVCAKMFVSKGGGRQSVVNDQKGIIIDAVTVDTLSVSPTYVKADIEGMEEKMLLGAKKALGQKPKLNIAAYHRSTDLFTLPQLIHSINPEYKIYLRKHPYIPCWDMNLYCI